MFELDDIEIIKEAIKNTNSPLSSFLKENEFIDISKINNGYVALYENSSTSFGEGSILEIKDINKNSKYYYISSFDHLEKSLFYINELFNFPYLIKDHINNRTFSVNKFHGINDSYFLTEVQRKDMLKLGKKLEIY